MTQSSSVLYKQSTAPGSSVSKHDRGRWEVGENTDTFFNKCKFLTFYCCSNKATLWYYKKLLRFGFRYWNKRHPRGISRSGANGTTYECLTHRSMSLLWSHNLKTTTTKKTALTDMLTFCLPLFAFDHHYLTRFKTSQGRMRSLRPGPPLPSAPAPLVHAQSIWNVHVETIKGSQMAELAENAMKHIRPGPGPCWANMEC